MEILLHYPELFRRRDQVISGKVATSFPGIARVSDHKAYIHRIRRHSYTLKRGVVVIRNNGKKTNDDVDLNAVNADGTPTVRVRLPKKWANEQFAFADLMQGANHIRVRCYDGVTRMGRIKGKIKKRVWIREGDILIVCPWSFQDEKCDIIYRYLPPQADWLRKNRYL